MVGDEGLFDRQLVELDRLPGGLAPVDTTRYPVFDRRQYGLYGGSILLRCYLTEPVEYDAYGLNGREQYSTGRASRVCG